jgi:hypothetical protein
LLHVAAINEEQKNWPTANARDWKDSITGTHPPSRPRMSEQTLGQAVSVVHGSWATPAARDTQGQRGAAANARKGNPLDTLPNQMAVYGQAAPASSSLLGSRQGLSWATPRASERDGTRTPNGNPKKDGIPLGMQAKQWATPQANDAQGPKTPEQIAVMRAKGHGVKNLNEMVSWATPQAKDHKSGHRDPTIVQYKQLNVEVEARATGKLNQAWVCCLMGVPVGWVDPMCPASVIKNWPRFVSGWLRPQTAPIPCDSSAMESCLPPQSEPSEFSLAS